MRNGVHQLMMTEYPTFQPNRLAIEIRLNKTKMLTKRLKPLTIDECVREGGQPLRNAIEMRNEFPLHQLVPGQSNWNMHLAIAKTAMTWTYFALD